MSSKVAFPKSLTHRVWKTTKNDIEKLEKTILTNIDSRASTIIYTLHEKHFQLKAR